MPRLFAVSAVVLSLMGGATQAADLARQSRLGAVFAESAAPRGPIGREVKSEFVYAPEVDIRPLVQGYYGKPNSFFYRSYYGTPSSVIFGRLPYACGSYGYC